MRVALKHKKKEVRRHQGNTAGLVFTLFLALFCSIALYLPCDPCLIRPSKEVATIIEQSAKREEISPSLIEAVILTESKFDEKAVSHVGAVGLMQLMPETAKWISDESGLPMDKLEQAEQNIPLGAWYLSYLLEKYKNNEVLALAAYNAGRGNVDEWMEKEGWKDDFSEINRIPFPETREFVKSVVSARDRLESERQEQEKDRVNGRSK